MFEDRFECYSLPEVRASHLAETILRAIAQTFTRSGAKKEQRRESSFSDGVPETFQALPW